jgi:hypothetical protein
VEEDDGAVLETAAREREGRREAKWTCSKDADIT